MVGARKGNAYRDRVKTQENAILRKRKREAYRANLENQNDGVFEALRALWLL